MAVNSLKETIVAGLEQVKVPKTGLVDLVFGNAQEMTFDTENVNVDMFDGTRGIAGYSARGTKGVTVGLDGWDTVNHIPPMINEHFTITADDLKVRNFGESGVNATNQGKFQTIVNRQILKLQSRKQRAYTKQVADLITTGKLLITEKDGDGGVKATRTIDFKIPSTHIYTVGTPWNDANATIFDDMEAIDDTIVETSGVTPTWAICGKETISDIVNNDKISKLIDGRRVEFGNLVKEVRDNGLTYWGMLLGKETYTFTDFDESGSPIIPKNAYIVGSTQAELDIYFASVDVMVNGTPTALETKEAVYQIPDEDSVSIKHGFKSAKLYGLTQSGAFGHLTTR